MGKKSLYTLVNMDHPPSCSGKNLPSLSILDVTIITSALGPRLLYATCSFKQEIKKTKPKQDVMHSLMARTFCNRRREILDDLKPVEEICGEYPCLRKSIYVSCLLIVYQYLLHPLT